MPPKMKHKPDPKKHKKLYPDKPSSRLFTLYDKIKSKRDLRETSLNTYYNALKVLKVKLDNKYDKKTPIMDADFLEDYDKVIEIIDNENKITSKKNKLTAVIVALSSDNKEHELIKKYTDKLKELNEKYVSFLKEQKKTPQQKKNWISYEKLVEISNTLLKEVKNLGLHVKNEKAYTLTPQEYDTLQRLVVLRTYMTFTLRNDYADMKILTKKQYQKINVDERNKNNYLVLAPDNIKYFYINNFKNSKSLGPRKLLIPRKLNKIINLWLKWNKSGWFLTLYDRTRPMTPNMLTKFLQSLFNKYADKKHISSSMIRHIVISHLLRNEPTIYEKDKEAKDIEDMFFHSKGINEIYRKLDDKTGEDIGDDNEPKKMTQGEKVKLLRKETEEKTDDL